MERFPTARDFSSAVYRHNLYVLLGLVSLHVAAVLGDPRVRRETLGTATFSGRNPVPADASASDCRTGPCRS